MLIESSGSLAALDLHLTVHHLHAHLLDTADDLLLMTCEGHAHPPQVAAKERRYKTVNQCEYPMKRNPMNIYN